MLNIEEHFVVTRSQRYGLLLANWNARNRYRMVSLTLLKSFCDSFEDIVYYSSVALMHIYNLFEI